MSALLLMPPQLREVELADVAPAELVGAMVFDPEGRRVARVLRIEGDHHLVLGLRAWFGLVTHRFRLPLAQVALLRGPDGLIHVETRTDRATLRQMPRA